jgi:hypothetical protein
LRVRVLAGRCASLIGDDVIPVVQGQSVGIAAGNVGHRRAGVAVGNTEGRARIVQRAHDGADTVSVSGATSSAGCPPANQPIGTATPDGTTVED